MQICDIYILLLYFQVICTTQFSKVLPIEDGEIFVPLTTGRPSAKNPSSTLQVK